ncbi:hypothetical protein [Bacillus suaedaesalsae]|uniref:Uncharacterized protein n=1 Tax=Bacillus suaedaesalsae TaxID=2810349 RepID=A0ABS2DMV1_9BACI|nr:hypothetical protein [Bacillus suaedaesalsae]MBM6618808.1 hypothetical protein [Bacillus suaedaesalsae]
MKVLKGKIISGIGEFAQWMESLESYYSYKTGMKLFPKTIQVYLEEPFSCQEPIACYINGAEGIIMAINEVGVAQISPSCDGVELTNHDGEEVEIVIPVLENVVM